MRSARSRAQKSEYSCWPPTRSPFPNVRDSCTHAHTASVATRLLGRNTAFLSCAVGSTSLRLGLGEVRFFTKAAEGFTPWVVSFSCTDADGFFSTPAGSLFLLGFGRAGVSGFGASSGALGFGGFFLLGFGASSGAFLEGLGFGVGSAACGSTGFAGVESASGGFAEGAGTSCRGPVGLLEAGGEAGGASRFACFASL